MLLQGQSVTFKFLWIFNRSDIFRDLWVLRSTFIGTKFTIWKLACHKVVLALDFCCLFFEIWYTISDILIATIILRHGRLRVFGPTFIRSKFIIRFLFRIIHLLRLLGFLLWFYDSIALLRSSWILWSTFISTKFVIWTIVILFFGLRTFIVLVWIWKPLFDLVGKRCTNFLHGISTFQSCLPLLFSEIFISRNLLVIWVTAVNELGLKWELRASHCEISRFTNRLMDEVDKVTLTDAQEFIVLALLK